MKWIIYITSVLAGLIWLAGGIGHGNIVYCGVAVVAFALPVIYQYLRKRK